MGSDLGLINLAGGSLVSSLGRVGMLWMVMMVEKIYQQGADRSALNDSQECGKGLLRTVKILCSVPIPHST